MTITVWTLTMYLYDTQQSRGFSLHCVMFIVHFFVSVDCIKRLKKILLYTQFKVYYNSKYMCGDYVIRENVDLCASIIDS